jgi:hypothetical protein
MVGIGLIPTPSYRAGNATKTAFKADRDSRLRHVSGLADNNQTFLKVSQQLVHLEDRSPPGTW